ncbi:hypothetical protein F938_04432 [Acinetobacter bereziniae LMG 1003 = CIP 70.12]|uniref:Uncharacterized protein n=1 Tax=Acinetobacter bereziniae LMG 1003 = CIP 70.12 TaxID=981324 RepID=N9E9G6_ACIBZ|nr:hypothetical protein F938_04432 [Acinetobacter bereziniae LMG 1003 = CIP 70.12]
MSDTIYFICCKLNVIGGITGGILNYPQNYTPKFCGNITMLTDAQVRKIKPLEKKTKYADEKGMYLDLPR